MSDLGLHMNELIGEDHVESGSEVPRTSTPDQVYKFSEHIHKDRHIFLGPAFLSMADMFEFDRGDTDHFRFSSVRLPSLKKVSLSLDVFHTPPQRRFNENINTYVDTRKRIKYFQYYGDYERYDSPTPDTDRTRALGSGLLQTSQIRKPNTSTDSPSELPPLKKRDVGLENTAFPFKLQRERTFNVFSAMPTRFTIKPMSLWRQKTDTLLHGKKLHMEQRKKTARAQCV